MCDNTLKKNKQTPLQGILLLNIFNYSRPDRDLNEITIMAINITNIVSRRVASPTQETYVIFLTACKQTYIRPHQMCPKSRHLIIYRSIENKDTKYNILSKILRKTNVMNNSTWE